MYNFPCDVTAIIVISKLFSLVIIYQPTFVSVKPLQPHRVPEHGEEVCEGGAGVVVGQDVLFRVLSANFPLNAFALK